MGLRSLGKYRISLLMLLLVGLVLSGCADAPQSIMRASGPVAEEQLSLLRLTLWLASGIGALVAIALLFVVWRFRNRSNDKSVPKQIHGNTTLEIAWTIVPIIILAVVAVPTVKTAFSTQTPPTDAELRIKAVGHQWWFEFQYPDQGFVTANEIYIPVGKKVLVEIESKDVAHSFWVPQLAGKTDMIPGRTNTQWFQADEAGTYLGQCAELCGTAHARMRFRVVAVSQAEFDQWLADRKAGAKVPTDPDAVAGKEIFESSKGNCFVCHAIDGSAKAKGTTGPNLSNIGARQTLAAGIAENTAEHLKQWIRDPQSLKPGVKIMPKHPPERLSDEDLNKVIKYLQSLK